MVLLWSFLRDVMILNYIYGLVMMHLLPVNHFEESPENKNVCK